MEKNGNSLDDFFRDSLKDLRINPPPEMRERIIHDSKEALKETTASGRTKRKLFLLLLLLFITGSAIFGFFMLNRADQQPVAAKLQTTASSNSSGPSAGQREISNQAPVIPPSAERNQTVKKQYSSVIHQKLLSGQSQSSENKTIIAPSISAEVNSVPSENILSSASGSGEKLPGKEDSVILQESGLPKYVDTVQQTGVGEGITKNEKDKIERERDQYTSFGIYYSPEWIFNLQDVKSKFCNNFGIETEFHFHNYLIGTGIGLSLHHGSYEYVVGTRKYAGTYEKLDSVVFEWDPVNYKYLTYIITSPENVYDTTVIYTYQKIEKKYVYIQIPLYLGYDFLERDHFNLGFRAGPILSILINSTGNKVTYDPGKDQIVQINQISPERIESNWQFFAGLNVEWKPSRKFSFQLEPQVKYYFNSVYEKADGMQKPWSLGIHGIIWLNFK